MNKLKRIEKIKKQLKEVADLLSRVNGVSMPDEDTIAYDVVESGINELYMEQEALEKELASLTQLTTQSIKES